MSTCLFISTSYNGRYNGVENSIKVMKVSLPLIQDLKSKAMRERHWKQLIKLTGNKPKQTPTNTYYFF